MSFLDTSLGFVANRAANRLRAALATCFAEAGYDVTPDQWSVLSRLYEEDGLPQNVLGERITKDKTNIARMIALMEDKGLVERRPDEYDKRQRKVYLSQYSREIYPQLQKLAVALLETAHKGLTETDIQHTIDVLNRITDNLS